MKREIKFRAYDLKKKIIFPVHKIDFNKINQSIEFIQGYDDWDKDGYTVYGGGNMKYANKDRYILMQFTGLKDKNGKEIYEGDILRIDKEDYKYIVKFYDGCFVGVNKYDEHYEQTKILGNLFALEREVIGNIYENSELLKEE